MRRIPTEVENKRGVYYNRNMKITVIFTGGTIGTEETDGTRRLNEASASALLAAYEREYGKEEWEVVSIAPALSENNNGARLTEIVESVAKALAGDSDGVIAAHGTDTLQYSAAAVRYAFGADCKPVVFVSASDPIDNPCTNALYNMRAAVNYVAGGNRGVKVAYVDHITCVKLLKHGIKEPENAIFDADRLSAHDSFSDVFRVVRNASGYPAEGVYRKGARFADGKVLRLTAYPGMLYPSAFPEGTEAVIIECYHSGTLRTEGEDFEAFSALASAKGIGVFLTGVARDEIPYESSEKLLGKNFTPLYGLAPIAAYVKLWYDIALADMR